MIKFQLTQLFFVFAFSILIFANAYSIFFNIPYGEALFQAVRIQTLAGSNVLPTSPEHKFLIGIQHILTYLLTTGLIVIQINL